MTARSALRSRWRGWWLARLPRSDQHHIHRGNLYLLPTGAGWMLALTLLVLLVASINFQLNLGYLLTFLLTGCALVSIAVGYRTLLGLALSTQPPAPQFAGQAVQFAVQLLNADARSRHAIACAMHGSAEWNLVDVAAQDQASLQLAMHPERRGLHPLPAMVIETRFPLGVFRLWTVWRPAGEVLVYPAPEVLPPPLPQGEPHAAQGSSAARHAVAGDFDGVRGYRRGDPLKLVVWKKAATALASGSDALLVRDNQQNLQQELWLDERHCGLAEREARLSRLAAWVLQAEASGCRFGLRLASRTMAPDRGQAHVQDCLRALALE
ncbi:DUF58 domain-containing protein [Comamonas humi]